MDWRQEGNRVRLGTNADWVAGGNFNIFTITGGPIRITSMFGHVVVACTGALLVPVLTFTPTGGGAATNICTLAVGAIWPVNSVLTWNGLLATALVATIGVGHGATGVETFAGALTFVPGVIRVTNAPADATAVIDWYISYIECRQESNIVPA